MTNSEKIRRKALSLGFDLCGIACCRSLERQYDRFKNWLADGCDGGLEYLRRNTGKRFDPGALCEGARSVIVCGVGYHRPPSAHEVASRIASYAHTRDYHLTIRERLNELSAYLRELVPGASGRVFTDTAPLAEKSWAVEAGLGWIGRNSLLANPRLGSFLLLGEVVNFDIYFFPLPLHPDFARNMPLLPSARPFPALRVPAPASHAMHSDYAGYSVHPHSAE